MPTPAPPEPVARGSSSVERWSFPVSSAALPADDAPMEAAPPDAESEDDLSVAAASDAVGLRILAPADGSRVPRRVVVRGNSDRTLPDGAHVRLFVRALVDDGRWYAYPGEIAVRHDGAWQAELEIGGPPNVRHEVRVGVVDDAAHAALQQWLASQRDQPLDELPEGFRHEASATLLRQ